METGFRPVFHRVHARSETATSKIGGIVAPGDFDGDGRADAAVYRPSTGTWFILKSSTSFTTSVSYQWGLIDDVPVPGDFDGDGKVDPAVYQPSTGMWFVLRSGLTSPGAIVASGQAGDIQAPARPEPALSIAPECVLRASSCQFDCQGLSMCSSIRAPASKPVRFATRIFLA